MEESEVAAVSKWRIMKLWSWKIHGDVLDALRFKTYECADVEDSEVEEVWKWNLARLGVYGDRRYCPPPHLSLTT